MTTSNRRRFITTAAALTAATAVNAAPLIIQNEKYIAHQVYFWLKNPDSTEDRAKLIEGIRTLRKIEAVRKIIIGVAAATEKRPVIDDTWSVSELALFSNLAGQAAYQVHPIHLDFVKNYSHLWAKVLIYDSSEV